MNLKRMWVMLRARNHEFFRDKAAFGWNFLFPFLIVAGFGLIFGGKTLVAHKVGVFPAQAPMDAAEMELPERFRSDPDVTFLPMADLTVGLDKLRRHKIDFLVEQGPPPNRYWVSDTSPKGRAVTHSYKASLLPDPIETATQAETVDVPEIRYIDWLFPGILGMNMMFSALWGVGYVVVRYRKNGVLKRLQATPLRALEYLTAMLLSRIFLLMFTLIVVWIGSDLLFGFQVAGSYISLVVVFFWGAMSLSALGLILASRGTSEEFTTGVLNFISWPMMFLSEVWFSIDGAPGWVKAASTIFPLTHLLTAARKIMHDGAGLVDIGVELSVLIGMTVLFLVVGASRFSWNR